MTRPAVIAELHRSFFEVGVDAVETDTFGAFPIVLAEYGIADRTYELNQAAARIAKEVASGYSTPDRPRWVVGSIGPGTKLPSLGQIDFVDAARRLRGPGRRAPGRRRRRPADRDGLRPPAGQGGDHRLPAGHGQGRQGPAAHGAGDDGDDRPDAGRLRDRRRPHGAGGAAARRHRPQLRHRPPGDDRAPAPPVAPRPARSCPACPTPGCRRSSTAPRTTTSRPTSWPRPTTASPPSSASTSSAAAAARRPSTCAGSSRRSAGGRRSGASRCVEPGCSSIYTAVPFAQDTAYLTIGERTNANGSKKFREAMLAGDWDTCVQMAKEQVKEGAHVLDVCVDYVGRDGVADMHEIAGRFATAAALPLVLDSTEPPVMEAGLQHIGGRAVLNSANLEDGRGARLPLRPGLRPGPGVRRRRHLPHHRRGGPGPHRRLEGAGGQADPRPGRRTVRPGAGRPDLRRPDLPPRRRPGGPAPRRHGDDRGHPPHQGGAARRLHRASASPT